MNEKLTTASTKASIAGLHVGFQNNDDKFESKSTASALISHHLLSNLSSLLWKPVWSQASDAFAVVVVNLSFIIIEVNLFVALGGLASLDPIKLHFSVYYLNSAKMTGSDYELFTENPITP